jgi:hypothetical protein
MKYPPFTYCDCEITVETEQQTDGRWRGRASIEDKITRAIVEVFPSISFDAEEDAFHTMLNRVEQQVALMRDPAVIDFV